MLLSFRCHSLSHFCFFMASRGATKPSLKIAEGFGTYNDLIDHSPIVITATVTSENKEFDYAEMTFAITAVEPIDIVRGDVNAKTLRIMQTYSEEDPYLKRVLKFYYSFRNMMDLLHRMFL